MFSRSCIRLLAVLAVGVSLSAQALPGVWTSAGDMSTARYQHTFTLLPSGKVLVTGDVSASASAELFDPVSATWSPAASLNAGRGAASASLLGSGQVLVAGGNVANNCTITETTTGSTTVCYATGSAEIYTPAGNVWNSAASMTTARQGHTATVLASGKILVAGGVSDCTTVIDPSSETAYCTYVNAATLYDPASNTWSAAGTLNAGRSNHTATLLPSGKVLVAGGRNSSGGLASSEVYDPATNTWSAGGNLAATRYAHAAVLLQSGKVYVAGGEGSTSVLASAELYDPASNAWSAAANLTTARTDHTLTLLPSGKVLIAAGDTFGSANLIANADLYDPVANTVTEQSSLVTPRYGATAALLTNGKVLIAGGFGADGELKSSELFDGSNSTFTVTASAGANGNISPPSQIVNGGGNVSVTVTPAYASSVATVNGDTCTVIHASGTTWTTNAIHADCAITATFLGPMSAARYEFTATLLQSGKVLLAGGSDSATADLYDPVSKTISSTGAMVSTRYQHTATLLASGKVLVTGGFISTSSSTQMTTTEIYDPATNTWSAGASMAKGRAAHAAALLSTGKVLVAGSYEGGPTGSAELYNPATNTWSAAAAASFDRSSPALVALASGKVLLVGGFSPTTQLYNPTTNTWSAGGTLSTPASFGQTTTLLASGKVLITGGEDDSGNSVASAFIYDPATNAWSTAASMSTTRTYHTATSLANGKLVVLGGSSFSNLNETFLSTGEIFDPSANSWSSAPDLSEAREGHTATPVSGGQILAAGGDGSGSVELYGTTLPDEIFRAGFED